MAENIPITSALLEQLRQTLRGEVLSDPASLGAYATDAGIYQMLPLAVVLPRDREEAVKAIRLCGEHRAPMLARGGGTSLTGQTVNAAVVLDASKHLNRVLELNVAERWIRVEPGLVRDELNLLLRPHQLHFAPDPATSDRATIGGMIASNSAGMRSARYGMTIDHVLDVEIALPTGEVLRLEALDADAYAAREHAPGREGEIYRRFRELIEAHREAIALRYPKVRRRSGGYALDAFLGPGPMNLAKLIAGSEGTLGCILSAKLNLEPLPPCSGLCLVHFASLGECLRAVAPIAAHQPSAVELLDGPIVSQARERVLAREASALIEGAPQGVLMVEFVGDAQEEVLRQLTALSDELSARRIGYAWRIATSPSDLQSAWLLRSSGLGLMTPVAGVRKPIPCIEDAAVPPEQLPAYIEAVLDVCARHGQPVSLYGHASVGLLHLRPLHDLHRPEEIEQMKQIQDEVFSLVLQHGGSWSGEHGDGIIRGGFNRRFFGDELYAAFQEVKRLFDPLGLLNPGKIVETPPRDQHLRYGPQYQTEDYHTLFHYRDQGGLLRAVEQCSGVGACRRTLGGTMCPSYRATRDELHSTRGRANVLRLALTGQLGEWGLDDDRLYHALDLCLSCKACKRECPNGVDMARLKAEYQQYHHMALGGAPLRDRFFASHPAAAALCSGSLASLFNTVLAAKPVRAALEHAFGLDRRRSMPAYAREPLHRWFARRDRPAQARSRSVVLYSDSAMEYHHPEIGQAAVLLLEAAGFEVVLTRPGDSQRVAISRGLLHRAKTEGTMLFHALRPHAGQGLPILFCEPSCYSAVKDDLPDLLDDEALGKEVSSQTSMIDEFLEEQLKRGAAVLRFKPQDPELDVLVHGHCHEKALGLGAATLGLLRRVPGLRVKDSGAGCCGMAGSFGYEREHYDLSVKIAQERLIPALDCCGGGTIVVSNGFSCRHQIQDLSPFRPIHVVELLARCLGD